MVPFTLLTQTQKRPASAAKGDGSTAPGVRAMAMQALTMGSVNDRVTVTCFVVVNGIDLSIEDL